MLEAMFAGAEQLFSRPGIWLGFLIVLPIAVISGLKPGGGIPVGQQILVIHLRIIPHRPGSATCLARNSSQVC